MFSAGNCLETELAVMAYCKKIYGSWPVLNSRFLF